MSLAENQKSHTFDDKGGRMSRSNTIRYLDPVATRGRRVTNLCVGSALECSGARLTCSHTQDYVVGMGINKNLPRETTGMYQKAAVQNEKELPLQLDRQHVSELQTGVQRESLGAVRPS